MIIVTKGAFNQLSFTLNGPDAQESEIPVISGFDLLEFIADQTGESVIVLPYTNYYSWRQVVASFTEGIDDPLNQKIILTGTDNHWTYKWWRCLGPNPTELNGIPSGAEMLETGKVWVEGIDSNPIDEVYK